MTKSPLRQPGAIEQVADVKKNLMMDDWNDAGNDDDEEDNDEIGERKITSGGAPGINYDQDLD